MGCEWSAQRLDSESESSNHEGSMMLRPSMEPSDISTRWVDGRAWDDVDSKSETERQKEKERERRKFYSPTPRHPRFKMDALGLDGGVDGDECKGGKNHQIGNRNSHCERKSNVEPGKGTSSSTSSEQKPCKRNYSADYSSQPSIKKESKSRNNSRNAPSETRHNSTGDADTSSAANPNRLSPPTRKCHEEEARRKRDDKKKDNGKGKNDKKDPPGSSSGSAGASTWYDRIGKIGR